MMSKRRGGEKGRSDQVEKSRKVKQDRRKCKATKNWKAENLPFVCRCSR